jgi:hypothetical protein
MVNTGVRNMTTDWRTENTGLRSELSKVRTPEYKKHPDKKYITARYTYPIGEEK